MMDTSKPLRTSRVEVSRFTSDTEPSNGTEWMNTKAFSPGLARMSSNTFSSVLYSESTPASPRGEPMVIGMKPPDGCEYRQRMRPGLTPRTARTLGPRHAVAARHPAHDGRTHRPGHRPVSRNVYPQPEPFRAAGAGRRGDPVDLVLGRHLLLRRDHQVVLGRGAQPAGERNPEHLRTPARPAGSAPPARSARSARRSAASRRSPWWRTR